MKINKQNIVSQFSSNSKLFKSNERIYEHTLNLPKTEFPMRANAAVNEIKFRSRTTEQLYRWQVTSFTHKSVHICRWIISHPKISLFCMMDRLMRTDLFISVTKDFPWSLGRINFDKDMHLIRSWKISSTDSIYSKEDASILFLAGIAMVSLLNSKHYEIPKFTLYPRS